MKDIYLKNNNVMLEVFFVFRWGVGWLVFMIEGKW